MTGLNKQHDSCSELAEEPCNLHLSNLPLHWNREHLREEFLPFGNIINTVVFSKRSGVALGRGFVNFERAESAEKVFMYVEDLQSSLHGSYKLEEDFVTGSQEKHMIPTVCSPSLNSNQDTAKSGYRSQDVIEKQRVYKRLSKANSESCTPGKSRMQRNRTDSSVSIVSASAVCLDAEKRLLSFQITRAKRKAKPKKQLKSYRTVVTAAATAETGGNRWSQDRPQGNLSYPAQWQQPQFIPPSGTFSTDYVQQANHRSLPPPPPLPLPLPNGTGQRRGFYTSRADMALTGSLLDPFIQPDLQHERPWSQPFSRNIPVAADRREGFTDQYCNSELYGNYMDGTADQSYLPPNAHQLYDQHLGWESQSYTRNRLEEQGLVPMVELDPWNFQLDDSDLLDQLPRLSPLSLSPVPLPPLSVQSSARSDEVNHMAPLFPASPINLSELVQAQETEYSLFDFPGKISRQERKVEITMTASSTLISPMKQREATDVSHKLETVFHLSTSQSHSKDRAGLWWKFT